MVLFSEMIGLDGYICRERGESCRGGYGNGRIAARGEIKKEIKLVGLRINKIECYLF